MMIFIVSNVGPSCSDGEYFRPDCIVVANTPEGAKHIAMREMIDGGGWTTEDRLSAQVVRDDGRFRVVMEGYSNEAERLLPDLVKACEMLLTLSLPQDVSGERMVKQARRILQTAKSQGA